MNSSRATLATVSAALLLLLGASLAGAQGLVVKQGDRVAVVGDSITEQKLYSRYLELYLVACQPALGLRAMQFGWSGERAQGFANRMANDLAGFKPNVLTTCYGMNDGGYRAFEAAIGKAYEDPMRDILTRLKAQGVTVLVGGPGAVDSKYYRNDPAQAEVYNENLRQLSEIAHKLATEAGMPFADVHTPMMETMAKAKAVLGADYDVCGRDGVHPGPNGQLIMAYAFLKNLGFDGNLGTIAVNFTGQAQAVGGHQVLSCQNGVVELESSRWVFCFSGDATSSGGTRSILPFLPFNQDLNRLTLVVTNLGAQEAQVTWGNATKTFTAVDLEQGINLAAEFLDHPFVAAFNRLDAAVAGKQSFETFMIKNQITNYPYLTTQLDKDPEVIAALDTLRGKLWARQDKLQEAVRAAFQPLKHTLTIKPVA